jgi:hypothetical protein
VPRTASRPLISASRLAVLSITPPGVSGEAASLLFELGQLDDRHELACLDLLGHSPDPPF